MTENEVIKKLDMLDEALNFQRHDADECSCALQMAIQAIEEIQQYQAIGTVEECRVAVERRKPRKPDTKVDYTGLLISYLCPLCGRFFGQRGKHSSIFFHKERYCQNKDCGQAIDWQEK